jgi:hypothetical protein
MPMRLRPLWIGVFLSFWAAGAVAAAPTVTKIQDLNFGGIASSAGGAVTLGEFNNDVRTPSVGVLPIAARPGQRAEFTINPDGMSCELSLPANGVVSLTPSSGSGQAMPVNAFTRSPSGPFSSPQTVYVGATLTVGSNQAPGEYHFVGFTVTLDCE